MKVIKPYIEVLDCPEGLDILKLIELCGRVCYKSEDKITEDSAQRFVRSVIKSGHESVLEHAKITVRVVCDRGISHEIVRHRLASYSQESSRYVRYTGEMIFIKPCFWEEGSKEYEVWYNSMKNAEETYIFLVNGLKCKPEEARDILPNSLKTEIIMTMNLREWRHFFKMRLSHRAHPQMREVAQLIFDELHSRVPIVFDDIEIQET